MKRRGIAAMFTVGLAGCLSAPAALAHHDGRQGCKYGNGTLPDFVTVEHYRMFQRCDGTRVTVYTSDGKHVSVSYVRDTERSDRAPRQRSQPANKTRKSCKKSGARKCRR